jgi:hypothetical protein
MCAVGPALWERPRIDPQDGGALRVQNTAGWRAMESGHETTAVGRMRKIGTLFMRLTVAFLLGSAITVAIVAAGLDFFPLWP